jgi:hypothetical protein
MLSALTIAWAAYRPKIERACSSSGPYFPTPCLETTRTPWTLSPYDIGTRSSDSGPKVERKIERRSTEASGMMSGSLRLATQPGSVSPWPLERASSGGDSMPTKVPEAATARNDAFRVEPVDADRVAVDQPADLGHDGLADGLDVAKLVEPQAQLVDRGEPVGERPDRRVEAGVLHGRGQLAGEAGGQAQVADGPWMRPAMHDQEHAQHLAGDAARHAGQADDLLAVGDLADLLGDRVGRVVQRHGHERALRPALHDRLERRRHVAVEGVEDVVADRPAGRQDQGVVRSSRQKAAPSATRTSSTEARTSSKRRWRAALRLAVEKFVSRASRAASSATASLAAACVDRPDSSPE